MTPRPNLDYAYPLSSGIGIRATQDPLSPVLDRFMQGYDRAFVLPDEKETFEGFQKCLALNSQDTPPLYSEMVVVLEDDQGTLLGGANFLATRITHSGTPPAFIALNYVYIEPCARGRGLLREILLAVKSLARIRLELNDIQPPVIFIEQNDPLKMTLEEYEADTLHSGLDQVDRLTIWSKVGARVVDFDFIQPALSDDQEANHKLVYAVLDYPWDSIPAQAFKEHLESFFKVSVFKGQTLSRDAQQQLDSIGPAPIGLLDTQPAIDWMRAHKPTTDLNSFRALARLALT